MVMVECFVVCWEFIFVSGCFLVVMFMWDVVVVMVELWLRMFRVSVFRMMVLVNVFLIVRIGELGK